jgi:hypothetical protein
VNSKEFFDIPRFITGRFQSVNSYVWDELFPEDKVRAILARSQTKRERRERLRELRSISEEASVAYFICDIRRFFYAGSNAAKNAVDTFKELGENEFFIGNTRFVGRNDNVTKGDQLRREAT